MTAGVNPLDGFFGGIHRILKDGLAAPYARTLNLLGGWTIEEGEDDDGNPTVELTAPAAETSLDVDLFGGGTDGNLTVSSGTTTLTRDTYYDTITLSGTAVINTNGFRLFCRKLVVSATGTYYIHRNGNSGTNGAAGVGGNAGAALTAGTLGPGFAGGAGNNAAVSGNNGLSGGTPAGDTASGGGSGGGSPKGGDGSSGAGGDGGALRAGGAISGNVFYGHYVRELVCWVSRAMTQMGGGGGGAGGSVGGSFNVGGDIAGASGGGGGGAGVLWLAAAEIVTSANTPAQVVRAIGGNGGNAQNSSGDAGGSCGGGGGGGGKIQAYVGKVTGITVANFFDASGGTAGNKGTPSGIGIAVAGESDGGVGGNITVQNMSTGSVTTVAGSAASGKTGGACVASLVA